ncbi:MAG TPA: erythromycin esterase family protein, partial [Gemmatimonadaceae bacterium]|nr:erythromycin esterase family protein [Gemmatimonadaceae bacterium]
GEASHGTYEFYDVRARITRRLIEELEFDAVAVEADWPDAYRVNRHVRGEDGGTAEEALRGFVRFPQWMWRNDVVVRFIDWLRERNASTATRAAGFYGIDLYSLHTSVEEVLRYLWSVDEDAARRARDRYACFDHFGEDLQAYGYATASGTESCEEDVVRQLVELRQNACRYTADDAATTPDEHFMAEQNARLVRNAERYYRAMFRGRVSSWNLRDTHMAETIEALLAHLSRDGREAKLVVWAHNSHLGDARATEMGRRGELNVGQVVRQQHADRAFGIGFTTHTGTVTAADDWDEPARTKRVVPSLAGSHERLMHDVGIPAFTLDLRDRDVAHALREPRLERAIGVIYRPETERASHYFEARLADQFDALIHIDETRALRPLERAPEHDVDEVPETYPSAL